MKVLTKLFTAATLAVLFAQPFAASAASASTPAPVAPAASAAISTQISTDAKQSQLILRGKSLTAAMKDVGLCGLAAVSVAYIVNNPGTSPTVFRPGISQPATTVCPDISATANAADTGSAITSMWAWGNAVPASQDARGLGEPVFAPATIASFAASRHLSSVRLSVPWAANEGTAISSSLKQSVKALHAKGVKVYALGGDNSWVNNPALVSQWITAAHSVAPFDGIQLDVEPWAGDDTWTTTPASIGAYITLIQQAAKTANKLGMHLNLDAPWWLATTDYNGKSVLSALLPYAHSVAIVAYSDHANGTDGIIAQAWPAVVDAAQAKVPFSIGVQTSSDAESGGAQYTFADLGSGVLEIESAKVRSAYSSVLGYTGVTVEEYASWTALQ